MMVRLACRVVLAMASVPVVEIQRSSWRCFKLLSCWVGLLLRFPLLFRSRFAGFRVVVLPVHGFPTFRVTKYNSILDHIDGRRFSPPRALVCRSDEGSHQRSGPNETRLEISRSQPLRANDRRAALADTEALSAVQQAGNGDDDRDLEAGIEPEIIRAGQVLEDDERVDM